MTIMNARNLSQSACSRSMQEKLIRFMDTHVYPNEEAILGHSSGAEDRWSVAPLVEEIKTKAQAEGLWNLFLPHSTYGAGLTNLEYAPLCAIMGRSLVASELFNCSAPDTGNMEVLALYGSEEQKRDWLGPLLSGQIRSAFAMTEPCVASSDATNIAMPIVRQGDGYLLNGRKWWATGAPDPRCKVMIVMGLSNPDNPPHQRHSMILVPMETDGVSVTRTLQVFGYDDAPHGHGEVLFENAWVPAENMILGEGC